MSCLEFCTCPSKDCPEYPDKHNGECTSCIKKNLEHHEIPTCFWNIIGDTENAASEYTFMKFAEKVMALEGKN